QSAGNEPLSRDRRHPFATLKMRTGATHFLMKRPPEGRHRDGLARARLQSHARHEIRRRSTTPGGDEDLALRCAGGRAENASQGPGPAHARKKFRPSETCQSREFSHNQDPKRTLPALGCGRPSAARRGAQGRREVRADTVVKKVYFDRASLCEAL